MTSRTAPSGRAAGGKPARRLLKGGLAAVAVLAMLLAGTIVWFARSTRAEIDAFEADVAAQAAASPPIAHQQAALPEPVARYFAFAFPDGPPEDATTAAIEMEGQFRRPLTDSFAPTTARQVVSVRAPDMVFSAVTPVFGVAWAVAYDVFLNGEMTMTARLLSAVPLMHETSTPALDRTSLRRWLLESPTYPMALLPGGPVRWKPIDDSHARAIVRAHGIEASLIATFAPDGALTSFHAEEDGDLTTPYHGSGEHVRRADYQLVDGVRVPMSFEISRMAGGKVHPFWIGRITQIAFGTE